MKLSEFVKQAKKLYPDEEDVDIRIVAEGGFKDIEILPRRSYYNEGGFGTVYEKGNFICIEVLGEYY